MEIDSAKAAHVLGDAAALREALTNLIFNAVDAMPDGGTITLRTIATGGEVAVEVSDNGSGMSEEVRERCLEPFFTTKGEKGTGLGLAMVFGIVQRHGGSVDLRSELGRRTSFTLRFPAAERATAIIAAAAEALQRPLHILVVDDQPILCHLLCEYLENDMHSVEAAQHGREALEKFRDGNFDLVITDQVIGDEMNGEQLALELKKLSPDIPVLLLTGYGNNSSTMKTLPEGIDLVLGKPLSRRALRRALVDVMKDASS